MSCELGVVSSCEIGRCVSMLEGIATNSASPSDIWFITLDSVRFPTGETEESVEAVMKIFITSPFEELELLGPFEIQEGEFVKIQRSTLGLVYEFNVYKDIVQPLLTLGYCRNFVEFLGGSVFCHRDNLLEVMRSSFPHDIQRVDRFNRNLFHVLRLGPMSRPSITVDNGFPTGEAFEILEELTPHLNYGFVITRRTAPSTITFFDFMKKMCSPYEMYPHFEYFRILFQAAFGLYGLALARVRHNDIHSSNIFVTIDESEAEDVFQFRKVCLIEGEPFAFYSRAHVQIYDFDRAFSVRHGANGSLTANLCFSFQQCNNFDPRVDMIKLLSTSSSVPTPNQLDTEWYTDPASGLEPEQLHDPDDELNNRWIVNAVSKIAGRTEIGARETRKLFISKDGRMLRPDPPFMVMSEYFRLVKAPNTILKILASLVCVPLIAQDYEWIRTQDPAHFIGSLDHRDFGMGGAFDAGEPPSLDIQAPSSPFPRLVGLPWGLIERVRLDLEQYCPPSQRELFVEGPASALSEARAHLREFGERQEWMRSANKVAEPDVAWESVNPQTRESFHDRAIRLAREEKLFRRPLHSIGAGAARAITPRADWRFPGIEPFEVVRGSPLARPNSRAQDPVFFRHLDSLPPTRSLPSTRRLSSPSNRRLSLPSTRRLSSRHSSPSTRRLSSPSTRRLSSPSEPTAWRLSPLPSSPDRSQLS